MTEEKKKNLFPKMIGEEWSKVTVTLRGYEIHDFGIMEAFFNSVTEKGSYKSKNIMKIGIYNEDAYI